MLRPFHRRFASVCLVAWVAAASTAAADSAASPEAARSVLQKYCHDCHGKDGRNEGGLNVVTDLGKLVESRRVVPSDPERSKLLRRIVMGDMPPEFDDESTDHGQMSARPRPSPEEIATLRAWIKAGAASPASKATPRKPGTEADLLRFITEDLRNTPMRDRRFIRYFTITNLANAGDNEDQLQTYRHGLSKLVNSLSWSRKIKAPTPIDPDRTILRIDLRDYLWDEGTWKAVLDRYPYGLRPDTAVAASVYEMTACDLPWVRADWFVHAASRPPLYHEVLRLPDTVEALERKLDVDAAANIRADRVARAAFNASGVSRNNRLIERHPSRSGYFWTSYDFAGNRDHQSLFSFPLGPGSGDNEFHHDGGESIFSLPNGFQGYYLNKATGERLDKGPTAIVRDASRKDFSVTNGISCMGCHDQGMRKAKDDIRELVLKGRTFPKDVRDAVEGLYPPHDKMDALIDDDGKRFADAMKRAGLDPALKLNGIEMINALAKRYEDDLDLTLAASEFGLTKAEFDEGTGDVDRTFRPMVRRLAQGAVPRDQFELAFKGIAPDVTDLKLVTVKTARPVERPSAPVRNDDLSLTSDKDSYKLGDTPEFTIVAPRDCFLTLTDVDERGEGTVLFPNSFQQDNLIKAGVPVRFPGANAPFRFRMKDKGIETVAAVCAVQAGGGDRIQHDFRKNQFTPVPNYTTTLARSILVEAVRPGTPTVAGTTNAGAAAVAAREPPPGGSRGSFRAAIRLQVR